KQGLGQKLAALPRIARFYLGWYPPLWIKGMATPFRFRQFGPLATHLRFVERSCRRLARESFHGILMHQAKLERKQGFLFRCVDVVMELFAMAASVSHAAQLRSEAHEEAERVVALADLFCRTSRRKVRRLFENLSKNDDVRKNEVAADVMKGEHAWLAQGMLELELGPDAFSPRSLVAS